MRPTEGRKNDKKTKKEKQQICNREKMENKQNMKRQWKDEVGGQKADG